MEIIFLPVNFLLELGRGVLLIVMGILVILFVYRMWGDIQKFCEFGMEIIWTKKRVLGHFIILVILGWLMTGFWSYAPRIALDIDNKALESKLNAVDDATITVIPEETKRHVTEEEQMNRLEKADEEKTTIFRELND